MTLLFPPSSGVGVWALEQGSSNPPPTGEKASQAPAETHLAKPGRGPGPREQAHVEQSCHMGNLASSQGDLRDADDRLHLLALAPYSVIDT